jgi:hypothetical protein
MAGLEQRGKEGKAYALAMEAREEQLELLLAASEYLGQRKNRAVQANVCIQETHKLCALVLTLPSTTVNDLRYAAFHT